MNYLHRALMALLILLFAVLSWNSYFATVSATDFEVYWLAARHFLEHQPVYDIARDGLRCFKYPPWFVPLFAPLGLISIGLAAFLFRLLSTLSLLWLWRNIRASLQKPWTADLTILLFWGFWLYNISTGQVTVLLLVTLWWAYQQQSKLASLVLMFFAMSMKLVSALAAIPCLPSSLHFKPWKKLLLAAVLSALAMMLLTLPVLTFPLTDFVLEFKNASLSLGTDLSSSNQGLTALLNWLLGLDAHSLQSHKISFGIGLALLITCYALFQSRLDSRERFAYWLAAASILHPLTFSYSFAGCFPLVALTLDAAQSRRSWFVLGTITVILTVLSHRLLPEAALGLLIPGYRALAVLGLMAGLVSVKSHALRRSHQH